MPADRIMPAIAFRLGSAAAFAAMGALIKLTEARGAHLGELLFFRQAAALPLVLAWVLATGELATLRTRRLPAHALRAAMGLASMSLMFATVTLVPLAEATILNFTVPIFATILAAVLLRERTGWHRWSAVALGFLGTLIVARPGAGTIPLLGLATGVAAALLSASVSILLRRIGETEAASTTVFYFSLLSLIPLTPAFLWVAGAHEPLVWLMLVAIGLVGGIGQLLMTASLKLAPVAVVLPMDYSGLIWATLWGYALFGVLPGPSTWAGAPLIIASGLWIVLRERRLAKQSVAALVE